MIWVNRGVNPRWEDAHLAYNIEPAHTDQNWTSSSICVNAEFAL